MMRFLRWLIGRPEKRERFCPHCRRNKAIQPYQYKDDKLILICYYCRRLFQTKPAGIWTEMTGFIPVSENR